MKPKIINVAKKYLGCSSGDKKQKKLVNIFNSVKPNGYTAKVSDPWCAIAVTAWAIEAYGKEKAKKYFPLSASVPDMLRKAAKMKIWIESDRIKPKAGDLVLYDWDDNGIGDNRNSPDHVGLVTNVGLTVFTVIEGNKGKNHACAYRWVDVDGRYIRGFIRPDYDDLEHRKTDADRISKLADDVIAGKYGNGSERKKKLGKDYEAVQAEVNRRLQK